jgi:hypothetical protein
MYSATELEFETTAQLAQRERDVEQHLQRQQARTDQRERRRASASRGRPAYPPIFAGFRRWLAGAARGQSATH